MLCPPGLWMIHTSIELIKNTGTCGFFENIYSFSPSNRKVRICMKIQCCTYHALRPYDFRQPRLISSQWYVASFERPSERRGTPFSAFLNEQNTSQSILFEYHQMFIFLHYTNQYKIWQLTQRRVSSLYQVNSAIQLHFI